MPEHHSQFAEFLVLFDRLKNAAKGDPQRVIAFYKESEAIQHAVTAISQFILFTDFERRVFHGPTKHVLQVPDRFELTWNEYRRDWNDVVMSAYLDADADQLLLPEWEGGRMDASLLSEFDPRYHDGGRWIEEGLQYFGNLRNDPPDGPLVAESIDVLLGAFDYLHETIGVDISDIFRRWRDIPITFMPAHVSNRYGLTEKGSLHDLINDAVRAYVCGAPAAAIAMCRAALEMVLKDHYGKGKWNDPTLGLGKIIVLASQRYDFLDQGRLQKLTHSANQIMHSYSKRTRMSHDDERTILEFLKTVKHLIQRAPR